MRLIRLFSVLCVIFVLSGFVFALPASAADLFTDLVGFATKTGYRGVFSWQATGPVVAEVHYGTDPANLSQTVTQFPASTPDSSGLAIVDGLTIGDTYYWQVEDTVSGERSAVQSFEATNAYTDWNGETYTIDLLVQLDSESLPAGVPHDLALENIAQGISIFAERLYDAMDGNARVGKVLVTDTDLEYPVNFPFLPPDCAPGQTNAADVLVQTSIPFDSHTFAGWSIEDPCISFYVGRVGQLIVPWGQTSPEDLHFGYVATHETMHYAFNAPDLYGLNNLSGSYELGCANLEWDGSVMHNGGGWKGTRWELTELDRNDVVTPCSHDSTTWTWEELRTRYTNVPAAVEEGPVGTGIDHIVDVLPRGNEDGGALDIHVLDQTQGVSTLSRFTPSDSVDLLTTDPCVDPGVMLFTDKSGDALTNVPAHDARYASIAQLPELGFDKLQFTIKVESLEVIPPNTTWPLIFKAPDGDRFVRMSSDAVGQVSFATGAGINSNPYEVPGSPVDPQSGFDPDGTIRIIVPRSQLGNPADGEILTDFLTRVRVVFPTTIPIPGVGPSNGITPDNMPDSLTRSGQYEVIGAEFCGNQPPTAGDDTASVVEEGSVEISVLSNDSDPEGSSLSIASVSRPRRGSASIVGSKIVYSPATNFNGTDSFTYLVKDDAGKSATGSVAVLVTPVPDPPSAVADSVTTVEGQALGIDPVKNDKDPDGDTLSLLSVGAPMNGSAQKQPNGTVAYTPNPGFVGTDAFQYTVSDGTLSDTGTVTVRVLPAGEGNPCVSPGLRVLTDPAGDNLSATRAHDIEWISIAGILPDGTIEITFKVGGDMNPPPSTSGWLVQWEIPTYVDANRNGKQDLPDEPFLVRWAEMNTRDVLGEPTFSYGRLDPTFGYVPEGDAVRGSFTPDGFITIAITPSQAGGLKTGQSIKNIIGKAQLFVGSAIVGGLVLNLDQTSAAPRYDLTTCQNVQLNRAPAAINDEASTTEDSPVSVNVLMNDTDPDGDPIEIVETSQPSNGVVSVNPDGSLTYTPNENFNGTDSFTYTITDGQFNSSAQVNVSVSPVNDPPVAFDDSGNVRKNTSVTLAVLANDSDIDGDVLSVLSATDATNGFVNVNSDGTITYTPKKGYSGFDAFEYTVSDGAGGTDVATVAIEVRKK